MDHVLYFVANPSRAALDPEAPPASGMPAESRLRVVA
jgi:hypothetical protein